MFDYTSSAKKSLFAPLTPFLECSRLVFGQNEGGGKQVINIEELSFDEMVCEVKRLHLLLVEMQHDLAKSYEIVLKERYEYASLLVKHNTTLKTIDELKNQLKEYYHEHVSVACESHSSKLCSINKNIDKSKVKKEVEISYDRKLQELQDLRRGLLCEASRDDYINKIKKRAEIIKQNKQFQIVSKNNNKNQQKGENINKL